MNDAFLVRKNLLRKTLRTILLIVSIFIAFLMFGVLGSFNEAFRNAPRIAGANQLIVLNKINVTQGMPYAYLERIRHAPGVAIATNQSWFGGYYQERRNRVRTFSVDVSAFTRLMREDIRMPEAQWRAFSNDRIGIIIGRQLAEKYALRVGQRLPLHSDIFTNKTTGRPVWDFNIVGVFDRAGNPNTAYFNYEYFRTSDLWGGQGAGQFILATTDPSLNEIVAHRIDAMFANSEAETSTQTMSAYIEARMAQFGDVGLVITLVVSAAFVAILLIVGNTMVMAMRERTKEIGVMKTLGFSSVRILRMVLWESLLLSLVGAGLGLGLAALTAAGIGAATPDTLGGTPMPGALRRTFQGMHMSATVAAAGVALAIAFGLVTGAIPAVNAYRLRIVDALARR